MKKVLLVNGSPHAAGCTYTALKEISDELAKGGIGSEIVQVPYDIPACRDCRFCKKNAFDRLNKYFTICNMPVASSQYWNQVHGSRAEDVVQDEEGLQTMRTLAANIAWLMRCIETADRAGVPRPEYEAPMRTDFIRRS